MAVGLKDKQIFTTDIGPIRDKLNSLLGQLVTISYYTKQRRASLVTQKAKLTNVSDSLFCVDVKNKSYVLSLSFTYVELLTGKVKILEVMEELV